MVVWIPEQRLLVAGDLVVAPTPYATQDNSANMGPAIHELIAMNPSIVIPGHGPVLRDLNYLQLLERAFTAGDRLRMWAYQSFFVRNIIARSYRMAGAIP